MTDDAPSAVSPPPLAEPPATIRRLAFLGTPGMAVPPLLGLVEAGFEIPLVVSRADKRRGRRGGLVPSPVKQAALDAGLAVTDRLADLDEVDVDLAVVVAYGRLIPRPVLERVPMVNSHFSLLPRWRGAAPIERALLAGDAETGVCLMRLEEGLDTGPVYRRAVVPIGARTTAADLAEQLVAVATEQLVTALSEGLGEPADQVGEPTYAAKLERDEFRLDWNRPAAELDRWVRVGGAWTMADGKRFKIWDAEPVGAPTGVSGAPADPGELVGDVVACGSGGLRLATVQPEGKGRMAFEAWRNGVRPEPGFRCG